MTDVSFFKVSKSNKTIGVLSEALLLLHKETVKYLVGW